MKRRKRSPVEAEAATPQKAISKALKLLEAKRNEVVVQILAEEEKGLFGMRGASQARVRVTRKK